MTAPPGAGPNESPPKKPRGCLALIAIVAAFPAASISVFLWQSLFQPPPDLETFMILFVFAALGLPLLAVLSLFTSDPEIGGAFPLFGVMIPFAVVLYLAFSGEWRRLVRWIIPRRSK
jgi:hypothetical protein